ncbi:uroporphyrin-3 C-methyltransferase [Pseudacidovorax intermedius]|uniref:Uroporphyrin-3 C-methyltransferase n=2 Tax=Pseudacidovorax intermedius TaxID=433924 RepID=A0A370FHX7_9BURK|nr:uroporphyrinogen-III C-methyltransferase [Pseudacidovorax intermedius]RDI25973.1 uroporphyrin-3 C-methyltransferase [Pseudacidovorax intermedius]
MSAPPATDDTVTDPVARPLAPVSPPSVPAPGAVLVVRLAFGAITLAALVAIVMAAMLWQKVGGMQEQLARQSADATRQATEARTLAREAQETVRAADARVALLETRLVEVSLQRAQVEEALQSLSRSRDESLLVDIDAALRLALEQAQATGNVQPLLAALKASDQRIVRASQPRLQPVQRAIQRDADRIRATASGDGGEALSRLDDLLKGVDELPVMNALAPRGNRAASDGWANEAVPADAPWWQRILLAVRNEVRSLIRVSRIDRPESVLLAPDQTYFLRENLKLKLLSARLALLAGQVAPARAELAGVTASLNRYFDPASRRVQAAATQLQQVQALVRAAEPPRIDDTLTALAAVSAGR